MEAIRVTFNEGELKPPSRCPVTGSTEDLQPRVVHHWLFAIIFFRRKSITLMFSDDGWAQHQASIGAFRRFIYGVYVVLGYVPLIGWFILFYWSFFALPMLGVLDLAVGRPGLVRYHSLRVPFQTPVTWFEVQSEVWVEEFVESHQVLQPVIERLS